MGSVSARQSSLPNPPGCLSVSPHAHGVNGALVSPASAAIDPPEWSLVLTLGLTAFLYLIGGHLRHVFIQLLEPPPPVRCGVRIEGAAAAPPLRERYRDHRRPFRGI